MATNTVSPKATARLVRPPWPGLVITRFVTRRTLRSATFVALAFGLFCASKIIGYADVYPTAHDRAAAAALLAGNAGFTALFGMPHHIETITGYASWYGLAIGVLLGSIWGYLVATKTFRGEEAAGRWEVVLAGRTTARRAAAGALAGLGLSLLVFYLLAAGALIAIGKVHSVDYSAAAALYFALAVVAPAAMFVAAGAFTSQLMPTRARAAGLATAIFGASFLLRAAGDITSAHWLLDISPLGWVEQLQPLLNSRPVWLLPIAGLTALLVAATVRLAARRDLGASVFSDHDTATPKLLLLRGPFTAAVRFTRASTITWLAAMAAFLAFYGALTGTAAKLLNGSGAAGQLIGKLAKSRESGARSFLGVAFFLFMLVLMTYVATAIGSLRSDEARGYLDNLLARTTSRGQWLWQHISLMTAVVVIAGLGSSLVIWLSLGSTRGSFVFHDLLWAGLNTIPAAVFTAGVGVFAFGVLPRLTTTLAYGVIAWSFIIELLSSGTNISHWIRDTSVFTHIAFAPAADPRWGPALILLALGAGLALIGALAFNRRDLASE